MHAKNPPRSRIVKPGRGRRGENPELALIDLIADQIQNDERLIDGLGDGSLALEDVETWYRIRRNHGSEFIDECGRLIASMRAKGFSRMMRRSNPRKHRGPVHGVAVWD